MTTTLKKIQEVITPIEVFPFSDGGTIWIKWVDIDKIAEIVKAKKQSKAVVAIHNMRNVTYWERYLKIWNKEYWDMLNSKDYVKLLKPMLPETKPKKKGVRNGKNV
jgi:hypothetical protein